MSVAGAYSGGDFAFASSTVSMVYRRLLDEILTGQRASGEPIRDRDIALEFGVSRTPVREAIQMLRHLGIVEASASRYTRIAQFGPSDIVQSGQLLLSLYEEVIHELTSCGEALPLDDMERRYEAATAAMQHGEEDAFWPLIFEIHDLVFRRSANPHLLRALRTVTYALRVAVVANQGVLDQRQVLQANRELLDALRSGSMVAWRSRVVTFVRIGESLRLDAPAAS